MPLRLLIVMVFHVSCRGDVGVCADAFTGKRQSTQGNGDRIRLRWTCFPGSMFDMLVSYAIDEDRREDVCLLACACVPYLWS